jgi:tRNA pseudouridine55 synthase
MDGVLLVDKPEGPTSHDVVARLRRTTGERSIGHTGTLDPRASGLLVLVCGRATRLASILSGADKTYEATIRLGVSTDTDDADGQAIGSIASALPDDSRLDEALASFRGRSLQVPPRYSAKKIAGQKAYDLARRDAEVTLAPVEVEVRSIERLDRQADLLRVRLTASAGFYVRALARDLGEALGCGAHLFTLRRTHVGRFLVEQALPLDVAERDGQAVAAQLLTPAEALADLPAVRLTPAGLKRAAHGNSLSPQHLAGQSVPSPTGGAPVRCLAEDGRLVALAHSRGGALHPVMVLG